MKAWLVTLGLAGRGDQGREAGRIRTRTAAWLAWSVWALCVPLTAVGGLLGLLSGLALYGTDWAWSVLFASLLLTFPTVGALIASRRPQNPIGWIFCAEGLIGSTAFLAQAYADYALYPLPGTQYAHWFSNSVLMPTLFLGATMLFLLFPDGKLPSPLILWRPVAWMAVIAAVISILGEAFGTVSYYGSINPFAVGGVVGYLLETLAGFGITLLIVSCLASMGSPLIRLYRARGQQRQQLMWFVYPAALTAISICVLFMFLMFPSGIPGSLGYFLDEMFWSLMFVGLLLLPIATAIAILRHRLYDIERIINRTLVYGLLTACVVGLYILVVGGAGALFQGSDNLLISLLATGLVALLFHPLRVRLQRGVNRLMYGQRDEPYAVLSRLGRRLEGTLAPEAALSTIVETVVQALKLPYAAIELNQDNGFKKVAEYGTPAGEPITLPLVHQGEGVGRLVVYPRASGETFAPSDRKLLEDLAWQAGTAAHAVRLTADLQRSRERLVTAREEERRRLRRDLHDGVGPQLAALMLELETASDLVSDDPEASALMTKLSKRAQETASDVRRSVHALRPPALDELGLVGALREAAAQYSRAGLRVWIEAPKELPHLPAAVEVACYRTAQEAMTNVVRHAGAGNCWVRIALDEEANVLHLEVEDDGRGIRKEDRVGVGMSSMRERAEELGGTLSVGSRPQGGTLVSAILPCRTADATDHGKE